MRREPFVRNHRMVKGRVYRTCVRPAMLYGIETVPMTKVQEGKMEVAEMKMLRSSLGLTRANRARNEEVRKILGIRGLGEKASEQRLRWYGHVKGREEPYIGQRMLAMVPPGKRRSGRPQRRYMDNIREDMRKLGSKETDTQDRGRWRSVTRCGNPD